MLIVSGWLRVVEAARRSAGCLDFTIAADLVDAGRITVYERWQNENDLLAFRGSGPSGDQQVAIVDADVRRYEISAEGPA